MDLKISAKSICLIIPFSQELSDVFLSLFPSQLDCMQHKGGHLHIGNQGVILDRFQKSLQRVKQMWFSHHFNVE